MRKNGVMLAIILFIISVFCTLAICEDYTPGDFKINKELSALLDREGFKFRITCNEAVKLYGLKADKVYDGNKIKVSEDKFSDPSGQEHLKVGFYHLDCYGGVVFRLEKVVAVVSHVTPAEAFNIFQKKYGDTGRVAFDRYLIQHHGRFIIVRFQTAGLGENSGIILNVHDETINFIIEKLKKEGAESEAESLKKIF